MWLVSPNTKKVVAAGVSKELACSLALCTLLQPPCSASTDTERLTTAALRGSSSAYHRRRDR